MKDKIKELIKYDSCSQFYISKYPNDINKVFEGIDGLANKILDLIAKELPKEKETDEPKEEYTEGDITKEAKDLARALQKKFPWLPINGEYHLAKYIVFDLRYRKISEKRINNID